MGNQSIFYWGIMMLLFYSAAYTLGYIHKDTTANPEKRRIRPRDRHSGWQDEPLHTARGEEALWRAVILQAMLDATCSTRKAWFSKSKLDAIHWLTGNSPDFFEVCHRAGLEPNRVRINAKKALANPYVWRTEAGHSIRYEERKAMRAQRKHQRHLPEKTFTAVMPLVLEGPWNKEMCHAY